MKTNHNLITIRRVVLAIAAAVVFDVPRVAIASVGSDSRPSRSALDNTRSRYLKTLDYYGLKEWYYIETGNSYELALYDPHKPGDTLSICYIKDNNTLHYPQVMPKGLAQQLIEDRMLIAPYQKTFRADDLNSANTAQDGIERDFTQEFEPEQIKQFKAFMDSDEAKGNRFSLNLAKFGNKMGISRSDVRTLAAKAYGLENLDEEQRNEVMKSPAVKKMVANKKAADNAAKRQKLGEDKSKTIDIEEATKAFKGDRERAEIFIENRDKVANGGKLNKNEQASFERDKKLIGYYEWQKTQKDAVGSSQHTRVRPRTTRKGHNTEALNRWRAGYEERKSRWENPSPRVGRTLRGKELLAERAKRRGKLTLTEKGKSHDR